MDCHGSNIRMTENFVKLYIFNRPEKGTLKYQICTKISLEVGMGAHSTYQFCDFSWHSWRQDSSLELLRPFLYLFFLRYSNIPKELLIYLFVYFLAAECSALIWDLNSLTRD